MGCPGQKESNEQERRPRLGPGLLGPAQGIKIRAPQSWMEKVLSELFLGQGQGTEGGLPA